ncbi:grpE protein homolog 2, mitochondrial [Trichomycterus rosablanca]|uniref:grpE protein homolog 2, mitochondrial n=1 Tax=Trichomycterus rosablanca TaxID=2290929 RepID=UPI002F352E17
MAVCFLSSCGKTRFQLGVSPFKLLCLRSRIGFSSTAAERDNTGHDCHSDDGDDDHSRSVMHVRMLEMRANKLEEQVRDLTQRYQRALADSDNVRRRTQKFVEDAKRFGIQSFCRDLVEVADLLEQTVHGTEEDTQTLTQSLELVQNRLQQVFTKHGLEKMNVVGTAYDPYQHEIVCHTPADGLEPGSIAVVKQDGYKLHGRTIRFAHVGIAVKAQES